MGSYLQPFNLALGFSDVSDQDPAIFKADLGWVQNLEVCGARQCLIYIRFWPDLQWWEVQLCFLLFSSSA